MLLAGGWSAHSRSRRTRKPANQKPADPRKTVKKTPRGKYGLPPRTEDLPGLVEENIPEPSSSPRQPSHNNFYQELVKGTWPRTLPNQQQQGRRLFRQTTAATPGLKRKVCPALNTTQNWTRLQRKVLPKYLLALDDEIGLLLLKSLARLQPPVVAPDRRSNDTNHANSSSNSSMLQEGQGDTDGPLSTAQLQHTNLREHLHEQQQCGAPPQLLLAEQVPTSITGALRSRCNRQAAAAITADSVAVNAAAVSKGFVDAVEERGQFELMLAAVYAVFQHQLPQWDGRRLVKAIGHVAQLHMYHDGYMQAWFAATAPALQHLPMPYLAVCLEALARLSAPVPGTWLASFVAASQGRLGQLTLSQQALLQMHIAGLQLKLPSNWWQELYSCSLQHTAAQIAVQPGANAAAARTGVNKQKQPTPTGESSQHHQQQAPKGRGLHPQEQLLSRPAADALCGMLWSSGSLQGQPLQEQWLAVLLKPLLPAVSAGRCSAGALVQLLHACSLGTCRHLPAALGVCTTCLHRLQPRLGKVCHGFELQLLIQCMRVPTVQEQLPAGWCESLEDALLPELPNLPTQLLLQVAVVFGECDHKPGGGFMSTFALATSERLSCMAGKEVVALVGNCAGMAVGMPNVWVIAVLQQLQQHVHALDACRLQGSVGSYGNIAAAAPDVSARDVKQAIQRLQMLAANWPAVQAVCGTALQDLQQFGT